MTQALDAPIPHRVRLTDATILLLDAIPDGWVLMRVGTDIVGIDPDDLAGTGGADATAWHNTGDSFGADAILGTTDAKSIIFKTNNIAAGKLDETERWFFGSSQSPRTTSSDISVQIRVADASNKDATLFVQTDSTDKESLVVVCTSDLDGGSIAVSGSAYPGSDIAGIIPIEGNFRVWGGDDISSMLIGCRAAVPIYIAANSTVYAKWIGTTGHFLQSSPTRIGSLTDTFVANEFLRVSGGPLHVDGFIGAGSELTIDPSNSLHVRRDANDGATSLILDNRNTGASAVTYVRIGGDPLGGTADSLDLYSYANAHRGGITCTGLTEFRINLTGSGDLTTYTANTLRNKTQSDGHFVPGADNTYQLGKSGTRWSTVYSAALNTGDVHMDNEEMDSHWTLREAKESGEDPDTLYAINRRTYPYRKYKVLLEAA